MRCSGKQPVTRSELPKLVHTRMPSILYMPQVCQHLHRRPSTTIPTGHITMTKTCHYTRMKTMILFHLNRGADRTHPSKSQLSCRIHLRCEPRYLSPSSKRIPTVRARLAHLPAKLIPRKLLRLWMNLLLPLLLPKILTPKRMTRCPTQASFLILCQTPIQSIPNRHSRPNLLFFRSHNFLLVLNQPSLLRILSQAEVSQRKFFLRLTPHLVTTPNLTWNHQRKSTPLHKCQNHQRHCRQCPPRKHPNRVRHSTQSPFQRQTRVQLRLARLFPLL